MTGTSYSKKSLFLFNVGWNNAITKISKQLNATPKINETPIDFIITFTGFTEVAVGLVVAFLVESLEASTKEDTMLLSDTMLWFTLSRKVSCAVETVGAYCCVKNV